MKDFKNYTICREQLARPEDLDKIDRLVESKGDTSSAEYLEVITFPLGHETVSLRSGSTDATVFYETFLGLYHIPPYLPDEPKTVLDLGANIGLTAAHYCALFPNCKLIAAEADPTSAAIAVSNTLPWRDRCTVKSVAVWKDDGGAMFGVQKGKEYAGHIGGQGEQIVVKTTTIDALIDELGVDCVDFVKMDIEGAEEVLIKSHNSWTKRVRAILVELHGYPKKKCIEKLRRLGFAAQSHEKHWDSVFATRIEQPSFRLNRLFGFWR